ncbi:MAG: hypothetical protein R2701_03455 [Acidimicrobiales bacterium]
MGAKLQEGVLLLAELPEVEAVRVEVAKLAELALANEVAKGEEHRVVLEQVTDHQGEVGSVC